MTDGPLPDFPFRRSLHNRLSERRADQAFLDSCWQDGRARVLVIRGTELAASEDASRLVWVEPAEAPAGDRLLLGDVDGVAHFAVLATDADAPCSPLRRLATRLSPLDASFAVHAAALASWHTRHPRCSVCGAQTVVARAGEMRACPECGAEHFPRTDPAVIMTVVDDEDRCLLGHNAARPDGWYSTLAGFVEPGESPEDAVVREVHEEVGVMVDDVRYFGAQPWPFPSSLMLGYQAHAKTAEIRVDGAEITEARWFTREELKDAVESGQVGLPTPISIAGALVMHWYGGELPANDPSL